jgi:ubiquinone/menaquinone biosynthesis C-methylase UbiE
VTPNDPDFLTAQRVFFEEADEAHYRWQTENPLIAGTERELLSGFPIAAGTVLEVGCGEGGNLVNLLSANAVGALVVGLDLFERKLTFARANVPGARFVCGNALALPFRDRAFDAVLCRDVLHHLDVREPALRELRRVCKPGGNIWILEPNGDNPLMRLLALLRPHERGLLRNSVASLSALVGGQFEQVRTESRQPMPVYRVLLHYRLGLPGLGRSKILTELARHWDIAVARVLPRKWWGYVLIRVTS